MKQAVTNQTMHSHALYKKLVVNGDALEAPVTRLAINLDAVTERLRTTEGGGETTEKAVRDAVTNFLTIRKLDGLSRNGSTR